MLGRSFSHYRVVSRLGQGGMGVVYLADDTLLGRQVAIKFPSATAAHRSRLLIEARAASSLNHPNIAAIYDCGELDDSLYVVMELVEGLSLSDVLRPGPLPAGRALDIVAQVAEALREAHGRHIIHRDIKPSNIRINERGAVKVVDFGLAKDLSERPAVAHAGAGMSLAATQTIEGTVSGTPRYMSPEQARGESGDERSDLFSLGVVLYECLTGRTAFHGESTMDALAQVLQLEPPPPSELNPAVPPEADRVVRKAMAKNVTERYQSAEEMLRDLESARAALGEPSSRRRPARAAARKLQTRHVVIALALLAALIAALWWLRAGSLYRPSPEAQRWYAEGAAAIRDATYYKASKALERAVGLDKRFALARARLAEAYNELDDTGRAQQELLVAVSPAGPRLPALDELTVRAVYRTLTGDFAGAVGIYREILGNAPEAEKANVWLDLGRAWEKAQNPKEAIEAYQQAARLSPQYPAAFLRLGILHGRARDRGRAMAAFDQAASLYGALSNLEGVTEVLYQRAVLEAQLGNIAEASALLERALGMARSAGNNHQQIAVMFQMGELGYRQGDTAASEKNVSEALDLARRDGLELLTIRGLLSLGNAYFVRGEPDRAEKNFREALDNARRAKAQRSEARALMSLGSLDIQQARLEQGIREVEQALRFYRQGGYGKETAQGLILLGRARRDQGDYGAALEAFGQQLELARKTGDAAQTAIAEEGIGAVLYQQERFPEALAHFRERLSISRSRAEQLGTAYGLLQSAGVLRSLGRFEEARAVLAEAGQLASRPGGYTAVSRLVDLRLADIALAQRQFDIARRRARALLADSEKLDPTTAVEARYVFGIASLSSGGRAEGRRACGEALEIARKHAVSRQVSRALLCETQAVLETGEYAKALETARSARELSSRRGQKETEAQALLLAARAAGATRDRSAARDFARQGEEALAALQQAWSAEDRKSYESRPDVAYWRKQLKLLAEPR